MTKRLLYAEDDDIVRSAISQLCVLLGWQVTSAPHGAAALDQSRAGEFDVVITDHHMPVTDGLTFVQKLRAEGFLGRIFVVSGALPALEEDEYRRLHVDGIVSKPVALSDLRAMLGAA